MAVLEVKNIRKSFGKTEVIRDISFSLEKGEVLAIIGSSGSGKTTLLRCLNFLETADSGEIIVNGKTVFNAENAKKYSDSEKRKMRLHFGLIFQQFNLFPQYTALKNVMLAQELLRVGTKAEIEEKSRDLLAMVGLSDRLNNFPCELSGGQQQRVAIARALALSPDILCFDEPTSALDPELTGEVLKAIKGLKNNDRTMIIVTHEMNFARNVADKIMYMADGVIEEMGTPQELFENPKSPKTAAFLHNSVEDKAL